VSGGQLLLEQPQKSVRFADEGVHPG
jgi:hypothetical protein